MFVCVEPTVDGSRPCLAAFHAKNEQAHLWILAFLHKKVCIVHYGKCVRVAGLGEKAETGGRKGDT